MFLWEFTRWCASETPERCWERLLSGRVYQVAKGMLRLADHRDGVNGSSTTSMSTRFEGGTGLGPTNAPRNCTV